MVRIIKTADLACGFFEVYDRYVDGLGFEPDSRESQDDEPTDSQLKAIDQGAPWTPPPAAAFDAEEI